MFDLDTSDTILIPDLLKATPAEEGGQRVIYLEASNQKVDIQGEVVLAKALGASADYFLQFGNLDLDHLTVVGPIKGVPNYLLFEIGRPAAVKVDGTRTMVKGIIAQGDGPSAREANLFWSSVTAQNPPQRWYPSVAGKVMDRGTELDPETRTPRKVIRAVRWSNIGFSKTPVNPNLPQVSTVPFGVLAKAWGAFGLDCEMAKSLTAGYGTDSATLEDGAALRTQSLDGAPQSYFDVRERLSGDIRRKKVAGAKPADLVAHVTGMGVDPDAASEHVERFLRDLSRSRRNPERKAA